MGLLVTVNSVLCKMGKLDQNFRADSLVFIDSHASCAV